MNHYKLLHTSFPAAPLLPPIVLMVSRVETRFCPDGVMVVSVTIVLTVLPSRISFVSTVLLPPPPPPEDWLIGAAALGPPVPADG